MPSSNLEIYPLVALGRFLGTVPYSLIPGDDSEINEFSDDGDEGVLILPTWKAKEVGFV